MERDPPREKKIVNFFQFLKKFFCFSLKWLFMSHKIKNNKNQ
jgi:hypothetical protein